MNRWMHPLARVITLAGLGFAAAYLAWRVGWSANAAPLWLSLPALLVELGGFAAVAVLAWALWWRPLPAPAEVPARILADLRADAVVRVDRQNLPEIRATLLAAQSMRDVHDCTVIDLSARHEVAELAREMGAGYLVAEPGDRNGLRLACAAGDGAAFVLLDAGDVPSENLVLALAGEMADASVAAVQGYGVAADDTSAEHGPSGVHDTVFERAALVPALGTRGVAHLLGSGALVNRAAFASVDPGAGHPIEAQWRASHELIGRGWRIAAPGGAPVLVQRAVHSQQAVDEDRLARARAARAAVIGAGGALRAGPLPLRPRVALLAWSVRPLSGLRRALFVAVVCACLLAGWAPFRADTWVFTRLWLPGIVATTLGLALLSDWRLRPGDRARWSLQMLGASFAALRPRRDTSRPPLVALPAPRRGTAVVLTIVVLSAVLAVRGVSDRWTHTLGDIPRPALIGLVAVALWLLALGLDALRMLVRRAQLRRATRVVASLPASLDGAAVFIVDVTAFGAGMISDGDHSRDDQVTIEAVVPTGSGITSVTLPAVVRNVRKDPAGSLRVGVEFGHCSPATANALAEYCTIEPARRLLGAEPVPGVPGSSPYTEDVVPVAGSRRVLLRFTSLLAVAGAVASAAPTAARADSGPVAHSVKGRVVLNAGAFAQGLVSSAPTPTGDPVVTEPAQPDTTAAAGEQPTTEPIDPADRGLDADGLAGVVVVVVCSTDAGADGDYGTNDDTYSAPVTAVTDASGAYDLQITGDACWLATSPPPGFAGPPAAVEPAAPPVDDSPAVPMPIDVSTPDVVVPEIEVVPAGPAGGTGSASIADLVWHDRDGDGVRQPGESGAPGVTVTLYDAGGAAVASTTTDLVGSFLFPELAPGGYSLGVSNLPRGLGVTGPHQGNDPAYDSDADPVTGRTATVRVERATGPSRFTVGLAAVGTGTAALAASGESSTVRFLAAPDDSQVTPAPDLPGGVLAVAVLVLAGVLGASILLGTARPGRRFER